MKRVLVLCTGNSCRSQMAEGYLRFYAGGKLDIQSAGLNAQHLNPYTVRVMEEDNIDMSEHTAKSIADFHNQYFDYLITVCDEAAESTLQGVNYAEKIHFSIPDPAKASGSEEEIELVFLQVRETVKRYMLKFLGKTLAENVEVA
ncbi:MAG: arsenate reductase ArsC [Phaeodactylibacter sp.]|uniref:arsenate reductase ArsC n=1 Tax=Phaeodactylibacter sp. TaxID=1940289 RepID=UPI0032ECFE68